MRKTITKNIIFLIAFVFTFVFEISETIAQTSDLPTPAQVAAKLARVDSINSYNASHPAGSQNRSGLPVPNALTTTGPEQDCIYGIPVCQQSYTQANSYTGHGAVQEVISTCLLAQEQSTVWYIFTVQPGGGGSFGFDILTSHDYDWALYNLSAIGGCSFVPTSTPVRCNFSGTYGNTGLWAPGSGSGTFTTDLETNHYSIPAPGSPWEPGITTVNPGQTYALVMDNFTLDALGYTINFTGTAIIRDITAPTISSVVYNCDKTITLNMSEQIRCSTVAANGSDFSVSSPAGFTVSAESGVGCSGSNITNQVVLTLTGNPVSGTYTFTVKNGGDGNTLLDKCGNALAIGTTVVINYLAPITLSAAPTSICAGATSNLTAAGGPGVGATYTWTPSASITSGAGTATPVATPSATTTYQCSVVYGGCTTIKTVTVTVNPIPIVSITPMNPVLCSGTTILTASATSCAGCVYNWSGATYTGTSNPTPAVGAGAETVTATSSGCVSAPVTSTVSLTPSAGSCNLYYATPAGAGTKDGTSIANAASAATLNALLSAVSCGGATIKMAVGVYTLTDNLDLSSNTTVEGGFNSTFTIKTSNMSGGASSTTLQRTGTPDGGAGLIVSCFNVAAGASNFRLQDLRIEMPGVNGINGSTNAAVNPVSSVLTNRAINLGAGCTSYFIVRCHIDGGKGAM